MTYKSVLKKLIEKDADRYMADVLHMHGIDFKFIWSDDVQIEKDDAHGFLWEVKLVVKDDVPHHPHHCVIVGGTVDDILGITPSVIWDKKKRHILWMASKKTRANLGISSFRFSA